jgi:hypothetical protein
MASETVVHVRFQLDVVRSQRVLHGARCAIASQSLLVER